MATHPVKIETYQDKKGEYRWRMIRSGNIIADCAEGYNQRSAATRAAQRLADAVYQSVAAGTLSVIPVPAGKK